MAKLIRALPEATAFSYRGYDVVVRKVMLKGGFVLIRTGHVEVTVFHHGSSSSLVQACEHANCIISCFDEKIDQLEEVDELERMLKVD